MANWPRKAHESLNLRGSIKPVRISRTIKIKKVVARDGGCRVFVIRAATIGVLAKHWSCFMCQALQKYYGDYNIL